MWVLALASCAAGKEQSSPDRTVPEAAPCLSCNDSNPCTADRCLVGGGCAHDPLPAGAPCDDGNACTDEDVCDGVGVCAGKAMADTIYRYHHLGTGAYYYTRGSTGPDGFGFEKKLFGALRASVAGSASLIRMHSPKYNEFMLSLDANEMTACCGYTPNGTLGYVFSAAKPGAVPLHRLLKGTGTATRHLSSLDATEGTTAGFSYELLQGHVCPP